MKKVQTGTVIEFYTNSCLVESNNQRIACTGIKNVVVGDVVDIELTQDTSKPSGKITKIYPRNSILKKIGPYKSKPLASNITHLCILVTSKPKTTKEFIDKYLVLASKFNLSVLLLNNKTDIEDNAIEELLNTYKDYEIIRISAKSGSNFQELKKWILGKSIIFVGNSGSGKSTITSKLIGKDLKTNKLSNNQGVHTTSISSLYKIDDVSSVIDSPGVRDIEISYLSKEEILTGFPEIFEASKKCKYNNCNHLNNDDCEVINSLKSNIIDSSRYQNYTKFIKNLENV